MVNLNKTYQKKENPKVRVKAISSVAGLVTYREVGYFNMKVSTEIDFLEKFEEVPVEAIA